MEELSNVNEEVANMSNEAIAATKSPPRLYIKVEGPKVGEAKLAASDLAVIISRAQQALKRVGRVLYGQESVGRGRKKKEIEELCELFIVAWEKGSAVAVMELATPPPQLNLFGYIGEESLNAFVQGLEKLSVKGEEPAAMPTGFDVGVLETCDLLGGVFEHGINEITFRSKNGTVSQSVAYNPAARERVRNLLGKAAEVGLVSKVGRLEVLSGHGALTGKLWEADGTTWRCDFKHEHLELLPDAWMHTVKLTGRAFVEQGKEAVLIVDSLQVTDEEISEFYSPAEAAPFWTSLSLEELAEQQGVSAIEDLDQISALWPADDDPDQLFDYILAERNDARRPPTD
jgi:hypothetical protein